MTNPSRAFDARDEGSPLNRRRMVAREPSHDALSPERESAEAKRRQSPGVSLDREHRDHDKGNGWLAKDAAENPKGLKPPD